MQALLEKNGGIIPGVGKVEMQPKPTVPEVAQPREPVQENKAVVPEKELTEEEKQEQLRKEKVTEDLTFVLSPDPIENSQDLVKKAEYGKLIGEAKQRLIDEGINVDAVLKEAPFEEGYKKTYGMRRAVMLGAMKKMEEGQELSDDEKKVMEKVNIKKGDLAEENKMVELEAEEENQKEPQVFEHIWEQQMASIESIPNPAFRQEAIKKWVLDNLDKSEIPFDFKMAQVNKIDQDTTGVEKEKKEPATEPSRRARLDIKTEDDLNKKMLEYGKITDPSSRASMLRNLARHLYENGKAEWGNAVTEEMNRLLEKASTSNIEGLPDDLNSEAKWREWIRVRLASLLDPFVGEVKGANEVFNVITEQSFMGRTTRTTINGTNYLKLPNIREELIEGKRTSDGRIVETSELQVSQEIARLYGDWRSAHENLKTLMSAQENRTYKLPDIKLTKKIFNGLKSEDGHDPEGGSRLVAKAMQLYWAMAHSNEPEAQEILTLNNLSEIKSIFDKQLTPAEIGEIRGQIADRSGGAYYENLGLMYASFLGISAYGSDSILSGITYVDRMGTLIHSEVNRFDNDKDKFDVNKRKYRYLDDTVANALCQMSGGRSIKENGVPLPAEIGVHTGNLQSLVEAKEPRAFYLVRSRGTNERFKIVKKLGPKGANIAIPQTESELDNNRVQFALGPQYEEVLLDDLVKEGRFNEIDWGNSYDIFAMMKSRESDGLAVYKMYNLDDGLDKLTVDELIIRKDNFEGAMPQYNIETQQWAMYLWLHSLIHKNEDVWLVGDKTRDVAALIRDSIDQNLISNELGDKLKNSYRLGILKEYSSLFTESHTPVATIKKILGK